MSGISNTEPSGPVLLFEASGYTLHFGTLLTCPRMAADGALEKLDEKSLNWGQVENFSLEPEIQAEIDAAFTALLSFDNEASLCAEYKRWCELQGLPHISADEHYQAALTLEQSLYLNDYIARWDLAVSPERAVHGRISHAAWLRGQIAQSEMTDAVGVCVSSAANTGSPRVR